LFLFRKEIEEKDNSAEDSRKNLEEIKIEKDKFETEKNKLSKKINEMLVECFVFGF
jgi:predicted  nucleic acid-binding Zn-ribbon protein